MINFFRRIRLQLLTENKLSKYLIYAFGEILLVVLGILIALQINNWNEGQHSKHLELEMLREVRVGLESDLKDIHYNLNAHIGHLRSQDIVLDWLASNNPFNDTLS